MQRTLRSMRTYLAILLVISVVSCKTTPNSQVLSEDDPAQRRATEIHNTVVDKLKKVHGATEGSVWFDSTGNFQPDWIVESPQNYWGRAGNDLPSDLACKSGDAGCDPQFLRHSCSTDSDCSPFHTTCQDLISSIAAEGQQPRKMCLGSGDSLMDRFYTTMTSANEHLDVTSLTYPTGRFYESMVNAFAYLSHKDNVPNIRLIYSGKTPTALNAFTKASTMLSGLLHSIESRGGDVKRLHIDFGWLSSLKQPLWNHAKIIVADHNRVLSGGHNPWDPDYLGDQPIFDLSLEARGPLGVGTTSFVNALWDRVDLWAGYSFESSARVSDTDPFGIDNPQSKTRIAPAKSSSATQGTSRVIGMGRLGFNIFQTNKAENASDDGIRFLIDTAQSKLYIAQQDIYQRLPLLPQLYPSWALDSLASAVLRGVKITIAKSSQTDPLGYGMVAPEKSYNTMFDAFVKIAEKKGFKAPNNQSTRAFVCEHFELAPWRFNDTNKTWPNGSTIGAHSKLIVVDESSFYLGSQNLYPSNLEEFGCVVSDVKVTQSLLSSYWEPLWKYSSKDKIPCPQ